uniref:TonB-dependent receptor n=1 Tax=Sphingomonas bacterium TaxID=1895847 RepID=UPI0015753792
IVVTGRGLPAQPGVRAYDVVTIDRARIVGDAADRLEDVLADAAGLQQFRRSDSRSANPTSQGIGLRGLGGNASSRALLILDGVPQADPFAGWIAFPAYATGRLGAIRVTRGGGSGYFGPGALTGTVEIDSATPDQLDTLDLRAAGGGRGSVDAQGSAALVRDADGAGGFATLSGAYARGDGFTPTVPRQQGPVDRPSPYEQASGAVRVVVGVAPMTELQANIDAFTDRRERGTAFSAIRSDGADASLRLVGRGRWGWSLLGYVQARGFANQFVSIDAARTTATETLDQYHTPSTGGGGRIEVSPPIGHGVDLRLGGDVRALSGRTEELYAYVAGVPTRRREAGGDSRTAGGFADASATLGRVTLDIGGRLDAWRIADGMLAERSLAGAALTNTRFADRSGAEPSGRGGIAWRAAAPVTVRAAVYRGWRLPTLNELYRSFRVGADATAANAALTPEHSFGYEGGVDLTPLPRLTLSATAFDNRLTDPIVNVTLGQGPGTFPLVGVVAAGGAYRIRENLSAIRLRGVEVDARYAIGRWSAQASWAHAAARVEASGAAVGLDGLHPAQTPLDQVSATLAWARVDGPSLSATARHSSSRFDDDQNSRALAPATTLDTRAALPLGRGLAVEARAENLFDEEVQTGTSGAGIVERATPRTLWMGLLYRLR